MKKIYFVLSFIIFVFLTTNIIAQPQSNNWYFGSSAAVTFSSGSPVAVAGSAISTFEGCSTISDATTGNLLFYTDGISVWDRTNNVMPNGNFSLFGNSSSTQSGIIVQKPGSTSLFYVFTADAQGGSNGICYSIVDMTLNGGFGDVSVLNTNIMSQGSEKLTAVRHANGTDVWVIMHGVSDNNYYAYLLTSAGLTGGPVISSVGLFCTNYSGGYDETIGYLKASPNGRRLAAAFWWEIDTVQVLDFNNCNGVVSNPISIGYGYPGDDPYGVAFSPNNNVLYVGCWVNQKLYQYDLSSGNQATINASQYLITSGTYPCAAIQLGLDGKLYVSRFGSSFLDAINTPNGLGAACGYAANAVSIAPGSCAGGLPNFYDAVNALTTVVSMPLDTAVCSAPLTLDAGAGGTSYLWSNGDTTQTSTINAPGVYSVIITGDTVCGNTTTMYDTITVTISPAPVVNLGVDTTLCVGQSLTLNAGNPGDTYHWSTGANSQTINVNTSGTYWVNVNVGACADTDTIVVNFVAGPVVTLGNDTTLCAGQPIIIDAGNAGATYLWSTGANTETISPTTTGTYWVNVSFGTCVATDSINVTFTPSPIVNLGPDQSLCNGDSTTLNAGNPGDTYLWSTGALTQTINVSANGTYWVQVANGTCIGTDTLVINTGISSIVNLGPDLNLCNGSTATLDAGNSGMNYHWSSGETTEKITASTSGTYFVNVDNNGCLGSDTIKINIEPPLTVSLGPDTTICPGDNLIIDAGKGYSSYSWIPGGQSSHSITINQPGTYGITVTDSLGCIARTSIWVNDFCPSDMYIPSAFVPGSNNMNAIFLAYCENVVQFHMYIYNRWGQQVFDSEDISKGWDGTFNGSNVPQGTYVYRVDYQLYDFSSLHKHSKVGSVTLIK